MILPFLLCVLSAVLAGCQPASCTAPVPEQYSVSETGAGEFPEHSSASVTSAEEEIPESTAAPVPGGEVYVGEAPEDAGGPGDFAVYVGEAPAGADSEEPHPGSDNGPRQYTGGPQYRQKLEQMADPPSLWQDLYHPVTVQSCHFIKDRIEISGVYHFTVENRSGYSPENDFLYLFEMEPYENSISGRDCLTSCRRTSTFRMEAECIPGRNKDRLYNHFVICIRQNGKFVRVSEDFYVTNPEDAAEERSPYCQPDTKKGLLVEISQIRDAMNLGVGSVIVNIPFHEIAGEGIDYVLDGKTYSFDRDKIKAYDRMISTYSNKNLNVFVVVLNGWREETPFFYYPGTHKNNSAYYYHFNTATRSGYYDVRATMSFLAERYSGSHPDCGRVQNWIVGNEVNNQYWNYIGEMKLNRYAAEFERSFRVFYTAVRSSSAEARVYFSLDHNWMDKADGVLRYNSRDFLDTFAASVRKHGNIDWALAYHPYNEPSTEPEFWDDMKTDRLNWSDTSPIVNFCNLSVLTEYMRRGEMRDSKGAVRVISLTEEGFTSQSPTRGNVEELQAAAFAYAYYIADSNPYIDTFILSRQIDAPSERRTWLALGLWTTDSQADVNIRPAEKKYIWTVFQNIDRQQSTLETTDFAKEILGIEKWSDVIPGFRWKSMEEKR